MFHGKVLSWQVASLACLHSLSRDAHLALCKKCPGQHAILRRRFEARKTVEAIIVVTLRHHLIR